VSNKLQCTIKDDDRCLCNKKNATELMFMTKLQLFTIINRKLQLFTIINTKLQLFTII